jgi:hypothetical protein
MKPEYPERTTDPGKATGKLYHLRLRVECTLFVIYKAGCEPMTTYDIGSPGLTNSAKIFVRKKVKWLGAFHDSDTVIRK